MKKNFNKIDEQGFVLINRHVFPDLVTFSHIGDRYNHDRSSNSRQRRIIN